MNAQESHAAAVNRFNRSVLSRMSNEKPHLAVMSRTFWCCSSVHGTRYGSTPDCAYHAWQSMRLAQLGGSTH